MTNKRMLEGVRIIDLTSVVFGPYATQILTDLGADVIKIESPEGDQFRLSAKPAHTRGMSPGFMALNKGKKSVVLDLKSSEGQDRLLWLLDEADVFIHNIREDAIERLGFGRERITSLFPELIYVHCVGFGSGGRYAGLQAYDDVIQAASGAASLAGRVDGTRKAKYLPSLIADKVAGLHAAQAVLAAYIHKLRGGGGQFVEVPMFEAFTQFMLIEHLGGLTFDPPNAAEGYFRQLDPDRQPFPTSDGYVSIVPYTFSSWPKVFEVLGEPEFAAKPEFSTPMLQFKNQHLLYRRVAELTPTRTTAEWVDLFNAARVPCMAVRDLADILEDPHLEDTDFFHNREHPTEGRYREMRPPIHYEGYTYPEASFPPTLGQHTQELCLDQGVPAGVRNDGEDVK